MLVNTLSKILRHLILGVTFSTFVFTMSSANEIDIETKNKAIVQEGFTQWENNTGSIFTVLDPNVHWTIAGYSTFSKTYTSKDDLYTQVLNPLNLRLMQKIKPKVQNIYAEKDIVIVRWEGVAIANDQEPYTNQYVWFLKFKDEKIIEAIAYFDTAKLENLFNRIVED